jgi:serine/threonine protein kinase/WD40 repeat protein
MSSASLPSIDDLAIDDLPQIEQRCNGFENAWKAWRQGPHPAPEEYLAGVSGRAAEVLFCELLSLDLVYRRQHREAPSEADYLPRFPGREGLVHGVFVREGPWTAGAEPPVAPAPAADRQPDSEEPAAAPQPSTVDDPARTRPDVGRTITHVPGAGSGTGSPRPSRLPHVPGYDELSELGRGGMGVVYKARQLGLNRIVALKMIRAGELAGEGEVARFRAEAEAAARLAHPHIVQIHEIGEADGLPFFSLEYVEGGSLQQYLGGNPQDPREAARLVEVLARAMQVAHDRGVVHRDLKPANILLSCRRGPDEPADASPGAGPPPVGRLRLGEVVPKIGDFGLAKRLDVDQGQTQTGAVMGTPPYMAPEQAAGRVHDIGPRTDVWALGAILYELLTGRPPFQGATRRDTLDMVLRQEPVSPRSLQPKTPRDLETVCLKALQKESERRYASAAALADDLQRFLAGEPIRARPVGPLGHLWSWCRRKPLIAGLAAAVALLLLTLAAGSTAALLVISARNRDLRARTHEAEEAEGRAIEEATNANVARGAAEEAKTAAVKDRNDAVEAKLETEKKKKEVEEEKDRQRVSLYYRNVALAQQRWLSGDVPEAERLLDECPAELRGWEWHYLRRLCSGAVLEVTGYKQTAAYFSHGGKFLLVHASHAPPRHGYRPMYEETSVWNWRTGARLLSGVPTSSLQFSRDGKYAAYSQRPEKAAPGTPGGVKVVDADTGKEALSLPAPAVLYGFSPDGKWLAVGRRADGGDDKPGQAPFDVEVIELATGRAVLRQKGAAGAAVFSPDGRYVAVALGPPAGPAPRAGPAEFVVREVATGREALRTRASYNRLAPVYVEPERGSVVLARAFGDFYNGLAFSPDGRRLAAHVATEEAGGGQLPTSSETRVLDVPSGKVLATLPLPAYRLRFSPDCRHLVFQTVRDVKGKDGKPDRRTALVVYDATTGEQRAELPEVPEPLLFSADGQRLLTLPNFQRKVRAYELRTGQEVAATVGDRRRMEEEVYGKARDWVGRGYVGELDITYDYSRYLARVPNPYAGGDGPVPVGVSPDGKRVTYPNFAATSSLSAMIPFLFSGGFFDPDAPLGALLLWDVEANRRLLTLSEPGVALQCAAFSPDGRALAGAGASNNIKVWDSRTGQELSVLRGHVVLDKDAGQRALREAADRMMGQDHDAILRDVLGRKTKSVGLRGVERLTFSPDGFALVSDGKGTTKVWDLTSSPEGVTLPAPPRGVDGLRFSRDGKRLLVQGDFGPAGAPAAPLPDSKSTRVYDVLGGGLLYTAEHTRLGGIDLSADGKWAVVCRQGRCRLLDAGTWEQRLEVPGTSAAFAPAGGLLFVTESDPAGGRVTVKVWDIDTGLSLHELTAAVGPERPAPALIASPDGRQVVWGGAVREADTGKVLYQVEGVAARPSPLTHGADSTPYSPDGALLASFDAAGAVRLRQAATGKVLHTLALGEAGSLLVFSPDGQRLTGLGEGGTVKVWDARAGRELASHRTAAGAGLSSDGGRALRVRTSARTVTEPTQDPEQIPWQEPGKEQKVPTEEHQVVRLEVDCWDALTGRRTSTGIDNLSPFSAYAVTPDARRLVLARGAFFGDTLEVWDLSTGATGSFITRLSGAQQPHRSVAFSADGLRLAAGGLGPTLQVWDAEPLPPEARAARFEALARARPARHLAEARRLATTEPEAALFHLDRLLEEVDPLDAGAREFRGEMRATLGDLEGAAEDFRVAVDRGREATAAAPLALLLWRNGDEAGCRRLCARLLEKRGSTGDLPTLFQLIRLLVQFPGAVPDQGRVVALAEKLARPYAGDYNVQALLGAALCRAGQHERAVEVLLAAGRIQEGARAASLARLPEHAYFLALSRAALKQDKEARDAFEQGKQRLVWFRNTPHTPPVTVRPGWAAVLRYEVLEKEVETALGLTKAPMPRAGE